MPAERRALTGLLAVAIAVASLTGCSEAPAAPTAAPADAYVDLVLDVSRETAEQTEMRREELLATCMAEAGFEYVPSLANLSFVDEAAMDPPRGSREFARLYGYGLASLPPGTRSPSVTNPNDAIVAAMSQAEVEEYFRAMDGAWSAGLGAGGGDVGPGWRPEGCDVWARSEMEAVAAEHDATYVALKAVVGRVRAQAQQEYVDTHRDALDAWAEAYAGTPPPG